MIRVGVIFPGQGSQAVGMLKNLGVAYSQVGETFAEASEVLKLDLWKLVQEGPNKILNETRYTQPALLTASVAIWRVWKTQGGATPVLLAGHSLGEFSALVCAGAIEFTDAVATVAERARFMQNAVPQGQGAMAAVLGLTIEQVMAVCVEAANGEMVEAANLNTPEQIVIAGHRAAVERACQLARVAGAKKTLLLPVSVPSHCALMRPAAELLAEWLRRIVIKAPRIPVLHNVNVSITADVERIRELLALQLVCPVRWIEIVQFFIMSEVMTLIEFGPGRVLTGLNKRINSAVCTWPVFDSITLDRALKETVYVE